MFKALTHTSSATQCDFSLAEFGKSLGSLSVEMEIPHCLCCSRRTECIPVTNHPLCPHLPPSVTRQFMGLAFWEEQVLSRGHLSILLVLSMKNHQDVLPDASFQVSELPGPALREFRKVNYENLWYLHPAPSRLVISRPLPGGL